MNSKKKLMCAALSMTTALSAINALAAIPSDVKGTRYEEPVQVLNALNIMIGDDTGSFRLDDPISRSEVAKMAVHAMGLEDIAESSKGNSDFLDVAKDHWANGYIHIATTQKLIEGDGDGNFRPNDTITYAEAMAIMTRAIGHETAAEDKGGFPGGYMSAGSAAGLSKNVKCSTNEKISRGNVAFLTMNALEANMMEQTGFGQNASFEVTDKTLLHSVLKVNKAKGQIAAFEGASIDGTSTLSEGKVKIGDKIYDTNQDLLDLLGYNVVFYHTEEDFDNDTVILAMSDAGKNVTLEINADVFASVTTKNGNKAIEYFRSETSSQTNTAQIKNDAKMVYNGKAIEFDDKYLDMKDKSGKITLLDSGKDGIYDIVFVAAHTNMVVEEVTATGKVVDKYGAPTLKLDEDVDYKITLGFEEIKLEDLKEYDILSVYASADKELYNIVVTRNSVEGKVSAKDDKGFFIGDKHYKVADNYKESISIGTEGVFYLDIEGRIAAIDSAGTLSSNYAYLIKAYTDNGTEVSSFKLFTKAGEEIVYEANEKIKFNNATTKAADVVKAVNKENETTKQLVTFTINSDKKLTAISTAQDNTANGAVNKENFTMNYKLTDAVYDSQTSKLGNVRIDDSTIIFNIPADSDEYEMLTKSIFEDEQKYNAIVYDMSENFSAKAIVLTNSALKAKADASLAVVSQISTAINADDEQTDLIKVFIDGKEQSFYAEDNTILKKGDKKLEKGDLIQFKTNADNEIVSIRVLMDIQTKGTEAENNPTDDLKTVYGKVTKKFADSINVTVNDGAKANYTISSDVDVYSVNTAASRNTIEVVTRGDIQSFDSEEGNRIFLKLYKGVVTEAVIIK